VKHSIAKICFHFCIKRRTNQIKILQNEYFDDDEDDYNDVETGAGIITLLVQHIFHSFCHRIPNISCDMFYCNQLCNSPA